MPDTDTDGPITSQAPGKPLLNCTSRVAHDSHPSSASKLALGIGRDKHTLQELGAETNKVALLCSLPVTGYMEEWDTATSISTYPINV